MFFWKIDDETIRCLIHKEEISNMGFDLQAISTDSRQMEEFLNAIVTSSKNYIDWHTENGIQNYIARSLPADQLLVTISCTFPDVAIDRDLDQIKKMTTALKDKITDERLAKVYALSGEEKEKAFEEISRDLQEVCMGRVDVDEDKKTRRERKLFPHRRKTESKRPIFRRENWFSEISPNWSDFVLCSERKHICIPRCIRRMRSM